MDAWDRLQQSFAQQTLPKKKPVMFPASFLAIPWKWNRINRAASFCRKRFANLPQIEGLATIIGTGTKAEIWDTKRYEAYSSEVESDVAAIVEDLEI